MSCCVRVGGCVAGGVMAHATHRPTTCHMLRQRHVPFHYATLDGN